MQETIVNIQPQSPHPIASSPMAPHNMVLLVTMNDDHDSQPRNSANITHIKHQSTHLWCMKKPHSRLSRSAAS